MPVGNGRYGDLAHQVQCDTNARAAIVMIVDGNKGHGFSVATDMPDFHIKLPDLLRIMADTIEEENLASTN